MTVERASVKRTSRLDIFANGNPKSDILWSPCVYGIEVDRANASPTAATPTSPTSNVHRIWRNVPVLSLVKDSFHWAHSDLISRKIVGTPTAAEVI
jgi:hypothetical protein